MGHTPRDKRHAARWPGPRQTPRGGAASLAIPLGLVGEPLTTFHTPNMTPRSVPCLIPRSTPRSTRLRLALACLDSLGLSGAALAQAQPAVIYVMGGKFDKSFNQSVYEGAERWKKETCKAFCPTILRLFHGSRRVALATVPMMVSHRVEGPRSMRRTIQKQVVSLNHLGGRVDAPAGKFLAFRPTGRPGQEQPAADGCLTGSYCSLRLSRSASSPTPTVMGRSRLSRRLSNRR